LDDFGYTADLRGKDHAAWRAHPTLDPRDAFRESRDSAEHANSLPIAVLFGGIGDAESDRVPLQIGQFESDNRMDEQLRLIFLEGNGGGQKSESYELAAYFLARHVETDAWSLRGKKGYLFLIGDELNKRTVSARHIRAVIGDNVPEDLSAAALYRELSQRWHVFYVLPNQSSYYHDPAIAAHWMTLVRQRFLRLRIRARSAS
jgi:hypothetical protein